MLDLLSNYEVFSSETPNRVVHELSSRYCSHSMVLRSKAHQREARYHRASFGSMTFNFLKYGASVDISPKPFEHFIMLEFPVSGCSYVRYGDEAVESRGNHAVVVSSAKKPSSSWQPDTSRLMVQIEYEFIERVLSDILGHGINKRVEFSLDMDTSLSMQRGLRDYVFYLTSQINENDYAEKNFLVRSQMEKNLVMLLLCGQANNFSEQIHGKSIPGNPKYLERTCDYIKANLDQDLTIADLVEVSGVSTRALYAGFRRYLGTSPMLAIKTERLKAVHDRLLNNDDGKSITQIAGMHGFVHMGNFSKDYYRQFGQKPSDTLKLNQ